MIAEAKAGKPVASRDEFTRLPFGEAADRFLADRLPRLATRSVQTERERVKPIKAAIGATPVWRLTVEQVRTYLRERKAAGRSNATLNRELDIIRGVLKRAKRWHHFADDIRPWPVRENIGQALTYEEKVRLLKRAGSREEWQNAAWAARLALNTTMRGHEIKEMRWRNVDMIGRSLTVRKSKTEAGERVIPLNADAWDVILALYKRSQKIGRFRCCTLPLSSHQAGPCGEAGGLESKGEDRPHNPIEFGEQKARLRYKQRHKTAEGDGGDAASC